jgi:hypothetical protein
VGLFGKKLEAEAVVLEDEGSGKMMETDSHGVRWEWHTYVLEVRPMGEAPFRTESKKKVAWFQEPKKGDVVKVVYEERNHHTEIQIEGDPRYDPKVKREQAKEHEQAEKQRVQALLAGENPAPEPKADDPDLGVLKELEAMERLSRVPAKCPECGARIDQTEASHAEHPTCPYCHNPLPLT